MEPQNTPIKPKLDEPETPASEAQPVLPNESASPAEANTTNDKPTVFAMDQPADQTIKPLSPPDTEQPAPASVISPEIPQEPAAEPVIADSLSEKVEPSAVPQVQPPLDNSNGIAGSVVDPAPVVSPNVPRRRLKKKWMVAGLIILAIIVLAGGAAAAYVGYVVPHQPKYVVARAIGNTVSDADVKTSHFDGDVTIKTSGSQTFKGSFKGASDGNNAQITGSVGLDVTTLRLDVRTFNNDDAYIKIDGLKGLPELLGTSDTAEMKKLSSYITAINGQWISLDQSLLSSIGQGNVDVSNSSLRVSPTDARKIEDMYRDHPFLDVSKVHADETVNGMNSHHYTVVINRDQLYAFGKDLNVAHIKNFPTISQDDLTSIKKTNFSKYPVDVWIDTSRTIIDQVAFTVKEDSLTATMRVALSGINQPVTITKPTSAKSLMEILGMGAGSMNMGTSMGMDMPTSGMMTGSGLNALTN